MKKMILLSVFFVSLAVVALAGVAFASPVCGSTCPAACSSAGQLCTSQEQPSSGSTVAVQGRALSCVKKQNVGCGLKLEWPFVQGNSCPAGFTRDVAIDGPEDCGFLGLGAIFGGSVKYCHVGQQVECSANASCQFGFQVQNSTQCTFEQASGVVISQCCELGSSDTVIEVNNTPIDTVNNTNYSQVTSIQIQPASATVPLGGQVQFTAVGVTPAGLTVTLTDDLTWSITNPGLGNLSLSGLFTACANCSGGQTTVWLSHGPLTASASVSVVQVTDFRIEPQNVTIAAGGDAVLKATALNLATQQRVNLSSTWAIDTSVGTVRFPVIPGQQSPVAILRGTTAGNGTVQAHSGSFAANATVNVVSADGFQASQLVVYPEGQFTLSNGQLMAVDTDFFIVSRNSNGVFGPLPAPVSLHFDAPDALVAITATGGTAIQGVGRGQATLNISSGSLWTTVPVVVSGCTAGNAVACSSTDTGYLLANGSQFKTCAADGTWGACVDQDTCDNTAGAPIPAPVQGASDGKVCANWCDSPTGDPDCTCNAANQTQKFRVCSDSVTNCWGLLTCGAGADSTHYGSCVASPSCTGQLLNGLIVPSSSGYFNGYLCASTSTSPTFTTPTALAALPECQPVGSLAVRSTITTPSTCSVTRNVSLYLYPFSTPPSAVNRAHMSQLDLGAPSPSLDVVFQLADVTPSSVQLSVTDAKAGSTFPVFLALGSEFSYNANITVTGINMSYPAASGGGRINKQANFTFQFNNCLYKLTNETVPGGSPA